MNSVRTLIDVAIWAIIVWIVLGYVVVLGRVPWGHPVRKVYDSLQNVMQRILRPLRNVLPPVRIGGAALDLAPLVLILGLTLLRSLV
jgi:YggT family protein